MSKDVKLWKICQTAGLWGRFIKNWHNEVHILMSNLMSLVKVIKIGQKYFLWTFWGVLVAIICDFLSCVIYCSKIVMLHGINWFDFFFSKNSEILWKVISGLQNVWFWVIWWSCQIYHDHVKKSEVASHFPHLWFWCMSTQFKAHELFYKNVKHFCH